MASHKELYKARPPWKEAFREKCFQRLKNSRSRLVDKFRGHNRIVDEEQIHDLMQDEWDSLCKQKKSLPGLLKGVLDYGDIEDSDLDEILVLMDDIKRELVEEEKRLAADDYVTQEASLLESAISLIQEEEVVCPLCRKFRLSQTGPIIHCSCGVNIDTQQDGISLVHVKKQLQEGLESHSEGCSFTPSFSVINVTEIRNLAMTCDACSFMYIVI